MRSLRPVRVCLSGRITAGFRPTRTTPVAATIIIFLRIFNSSQLNSKATNFYAFHNMCQSFCRCPNVTISRLMRINNWRRECVRQRGVRSSVLWKSNLPFSLVFLICKPNNIENGVCLEVRGGSLLCVFMYVYRILVGSSTSTAVAHLMSKRCTMEWHNLSLVNFATLFNVNNWLTQHTPHAHTNTQTHSGQIIFIWRV